MAHQILHIFFTMKSWNSIPRLKILYKTQALEIYGFKKKNYVVCEKFLKNLNVSKTENFKNDEVMCLMIVQVGDLETKATK